jgi:hypothetical protein
MRKFIALIGTAFAITLAVTVGTRLSSDAIAILIGIVCGILATIPTSIIFVWAMQLRERQLSGRGQEGYGGRSYPPIIVVNGQNPHSYMPQPTALPSGPTTPRSFKVIGQENTETLGDAMPAFWDEF